MKTSKVKLYSIVDNLFTFTYYDSSWESYNNSYFYIENNKIGFIDSGKKEHKNILKRNLEKKMKVNPSKVSWFVATHGHKDHVGGSLIFNNADKFIQKNDFYMLPINLQSSFSDIDSFNKKSSLKFIYLGHHTNGSVAIYDKELKVLFIGDHICFFGMPLSEERLITKGTKLRKKFIKEVKNIAQNKKTYEDNNLSKFFTGIKKLLNYDIRYLCSGHGIILKEDINKFLNQLLKIDD